MFHCFSLSFTLLSPSAPLPSHSCHALRVHLKANAKRVHEIGRLGDDVLEFGERQAVVVVEVCLLQDVLYQLGHVGVAQPLHPGQPIDDFLEVVYVDDVVVVEVVDAKRVLDLEVLRAGVAEHRRHVEEVLEAQRAVLR